jgi:hypothetical protein
MVAIQLSVLVWFFGNNLEKKKEISFFKQNEKKVYWLKVLNLRRTTFVTWAVILLINAVSKNRQSLTSQLAAPLPFLGSHFGLSTKTRKTRINKTHMHVFFLCHENRQKAEEVFFSMCFFFFFCSVQS